jgi:hypothetical protein
VFLPILSSSCYATAEGGGGPMHVLLMEIMEKKAEIHVPESCSNRKKGKE